MAVGDNCNRICIGRWQKFYDQAMYLIYANNLFFVQSIIVFLFIVIFFHLNFTLPNLVIRIVCYSIEHCTRYLNDETI